MKLNVLKHNWTIREAQPSDATAIAEIYNQGIQTKQATFETSLYTEEDRRKWIVEQDKNIPS